MDKTHRLALTNSRLATVVIALCALNATAFTGGFALARIVRVLSRHAPGPELKKPASPPRGAVNRSTLAVPSSGPDLSAVALLPVQKSSFSDSSAPAPVVRHAPLPSLRAIDSAKWAWHVLQWAEYPDLGAAAGRAGPEPFVAAIGRPGSF